MDHRSLLEQGDRPLNPQDQALWTQHATPFGLSPFVAKASYVIGVLGEMVASAGVLLAQEYHLGALYMALDATELVGRCVGGFRQETAGVRKRLEQGLQYLESIDPTTQSLPHTVNDYIDLRNFVGHGAASAAGGVTIEFSPATSIGLIFLLTEALNRMWTDDAAMDKFAECEIQPLSTGPTGNREPVFIRDVQSMLAAGTMPGDDISHVDWRHLSRPVALDPSSPPVTGFG